MDERTYITHVGNLASDQYHSELIPEHELDWMLNAATFAARWADDVKRGLFYGTDRGLRTGPHPTSVQHYPVLKDLVHGVIGLFTEAGELMEHLHAVLSGAAALDRVNIFEEMGDAYWYIALLHRFTGTTPSQAWDVNIAKLRKRFPQKFTEAQAQHEARDLEGERQVLEQLLAEVNSDIQAVEEGRSHWGPA